MLASRTSPTGRGLGRTALLLVLGLAALLAAVVVVGWLLTHPLAADLRSENAVDRWFAGQRTGALTRLADVGTFVGTTSTGLAAVGVLGAGFALWRRTWWPVAFVVALEAGLGLLYLAGTTLDPRRRPPVHILQRGLVGDASFPSGHTATATGIAGAAGALLWAYTRVAGALLALVAVVPAYTLVSRLYVGAHHVSDVLTALVYASVWVLLCARLLLPPRAATGRLAAVERSGRPAPAGA